MNPILDTRSFLMMTLLVLSSCIFSPQPEPPSIDASRIDVSASGEQQLQITGLDEAVAPGGGEISVINLDREYMERRIAVAPSGSFVATLSGQLGDELRLQAFTTQGRSAPVYIVVEGEGQPVIARRPAADCLAFEPGIELDFSSVDIGSSAQRSFVIENHCDRPVRFQNITFPWDEALVTACNSGYEHCSGGPPSPECLLGEDACQGSCEDIFDGCTDEPDICDARRATCSDGCETELEICRDDECLDELLTCAAEIETRAVFAIAPEVPPLEILPGESFTFEIAFHPSQQSPVLELVNFQITSPETGRWFLSLYGVGRP